MPERGSTERARAGEDPLPVQGLAGVGVFAVECVGEVDVGTALGEIVGVEQADAFELACEGFLEGLGEHGVSVFGPFAVPDGDLAHLQIDVLESESDTVHEPEAGPVEECSHEVLCAVELCEEAFDLGACEDDGESLGALRGFDAVECGQFGFEGVAEEELECVAGDVLGAGGDVPFDGDVCEIGTDFGGSESLGVCFVVEEQESPDGA